MSTETRSPAAKPEISKKVEGPGPYMAIVRNHLDSEYMGAIEVELLKSNSEGNTPDATGEVVPVSYLSPFYGVTPYKAVTENEGFDHTQKSYGFWAVPPDVGTKVLVIFAEGNRGKGFWIGCIQDENMNFMVPGNASTTYNSEDQTKAKPVGEYNKKTEEGVGKDSTQYLKPCNMDACTVLTNNGLENDPTRGTTSSSARRDLPSMVFGWSSPGPLDRRPDKPTVKVGEKLNQIDSPSSRLTGTTLVMDDGDSTLFRKGPAATTPSEYVSLADGGDPMIPHNELFRVRTRTGHQILLHNSEDLVYIAHGSGKSYIEMTAGGKIDIYSEDSVSIHSLQDLNFKAGRNINLEAGQNVNIKVANQMLTETGANYEVKVGADGKITCAGTSNIKSKHHYETADRIDMNGPAAAEAAAAHSVTRTPAKGSGPEKENKNPEEHTPEKQDNEPTKKNTKAEKKVSKEVTPADTFKKCTTENSTGQQAADEFAGGDVEGGEFGTAKVVEDGQQQSTGQQAANTFAGGDVQGGEFGGISSTATNLTNSAKESASSGTAKLVGNAT